MSVCARCRRAGSPPRRHVRVLVRQRPLNGGNFAFLSLNPHGWDVPIASNCARRSPAGRRRSPAGSTDRSPRASRSTGPTPRTCAPTRASEVSAGRRPELAGLERARRPQGPDQRLPDQLGGPWHAGAPARRAGTVYQQGNIDKYDIIGFAPWRSSTSSPSARPRAASAPARPRTTARLVVSVGQTLDLDTSPSATRAGRDVRPDSRRPAVERRRDEGEQPRPGVLHPGRRLHLRRGERAITWLGTVPKTRR